MGFRWARGHRITHHQGLVSDCVDEPIISPDGKFMWSGEEWIPVPPESESGEPEGNPESSIDGGNLTLQDSVVDGDVSNVTNLGQDKVVHGVNIERIVVSQSLVDSYGIEKLTSGLKAHFSANSEVEVDGDLSELMDKLRAVIENIEEDDLGQIGPQWRYIAIQFLSGRKPGDKRDVNEVICTKDDFYRDLEFLQFGQTYWNCLGAQVKGFHSEIELLGFNNLRNHVIVKVKAGTSKRGMQPSQRGPVQWGGSRICAITIEEFCDYYRHFGNVRPRIESLGGHQRWTPGEIRRMGVTQIDLVNAFTRENAGDGQAVRDLLPDIRYWNIDAFDIQNGVIQWNRREIKM